MFESRYIEECISSPISSNLSLSEALNFNLECYLRGWRELFEFATPPKIENVERGDQ
jgi:hypothetical protein